MAEFEDSNTCESDSDESDDEMVSAKDSSEDESESLRNQLADIPLGELQKLKETVGLKKYNDAVFGLNSGDENRLEGNSKVVIRTENKKFIDDKVKREKKKKSEPEEMSSKRKVFNAPRNIIDDSKRRKRDPRFGNLSGIFNEDLFNKSYSFVEDMKKEEMKSVKRKLQKVKSKEQKSNLHKLLQRMEQQEKATAANDARKRKERESKKESIAAIKAGKKAFYPKKSDQRKLELAEKYRKLKEHGQLNKYMGKKRKKNASKEKKIFLN